MDAVAAGEAREAAAPRLVADMAALERVTRGDGPSGRLRLERELGCELATLLVSALSRARRRSPRACVIPC